MRNRINLQRTIPLDEIKSITSKVINKLLNLGIMAMYLALVIFNAMSIVLAGLKLWSKVGYGWSAVVATFLMGAISVIVVVLLYIASEVIANKGRAE